MAESLPGTSSGDTGDDNSRESTISLNDYLTEANTLEEDAALVLGASDDQKCSYNKGYVNRQALYACGTCSPTDEDLAGICLACSLECHDGHELFELYTKRSFRCDCGNSKYKEPCKLFKEKDIVNAENKYNHNFRGLYCVCNKPYPDPDGEDAGEMIQCCICEDWYHSDHLKLSDDVPAEYEDMICFECAKHHDFLTKYSKFDVDVTSTDDSASSPCKLRAASSDTDNADSVTTFMSDGWRDQLCRCEKCLQLYKTHKLEFLLELDDPIHVYEEKAKTSSGEEGNSYERGMNELANMNRTQQIELISGYNDMKDSLAEYLKNFAEQKKVVREEDIKEFFEEFSKAKRRRLNTPPSTCS